MAQSVRSVTLSSGSLASFGQALGVGDNLAKRQYDEAKKTADNTKAIVEGVKTLQGLFGQLNPVFGLKWT